MSDAFSARGTRRKRLRLGLEWVLGALVLASIANAYLFFRTNGFLPPPFFFNYLDSLMDGYNTAAWAFRPGAYDIWRSIYPPISFAWFHLFATPSCYVGTEVYARDCDWWLRTAMVLFFFGNTVLVWVMYRRHHRPTALPRAIAVGFGMPMLYALERANLIIPAFTFFALAYGPLLRSARLRWIAAACAANFKPYLVVGIVATLLRRQWRWFEGAVVACVLVYLVSWIIVRDGTPLQVVRNTIIFADASRAAEWPVSYYASSYIPLHTFLNESRAPLIRLIGTDPIDFADWFLPLFMRATQALTMVAAAAIWLRPGLFPKTRGIALAVMFALSAQETGAYAMCFVLFLLFFERMEGFCLTTALIIGYLLSLCVDYFLVQLDLQVMMESFLAGRRVTASYGLTVGTIIRPAGLLLIMDLLSIATLTKLVSTLAAERRLRFPWRSATGTAMPQPVPSAAGSN